ncbi:MAG: hypothetical protein QM703_07745 [Gemmatales bacterium]
MKKAKTSQFQKTMTTIALFYGLVSGLIAIFWIILFVAQQGINNLPLGNKTWDEVGVILALLVTGPMASLLAGIWAKTRPRLASSMFIIGGFISSALALIIISKDNQAFPLIVVTLSMLLLGLLLRKSMSSQSMQTTALTTEKNQT